MLLGAGQTGSPKKWSCCGPSAARRAIVADDEPAVIAAGWLHPTRSGGLVPPSVMCAELPLACARPTSDMRRELGGVGQAFATAGFTLPPSKPEGGARFRRATRSLMVLKFLRPA